MISAAAEATLRREVEDAFSRLPVVRPATWRDVDSRGGAPLTPPQAPSPKRHRTAAASADNISSLQSPSANDSGSAGTEKNYWSELSKICGDDVTADVKARIEKFVNNLSLQEIEELAGK